MVSPLDPGKLVCKRSNVEEPVSQEETSETETSSAGMTRLPVEQERTSASWAGNDLRRMSSQQT